MQHTVQIGIIFHSAAGATRELARAVHAGAERVPGTQVQSLDLDPADILEGRYRRDALLSRLGELDAMIFGSPTFMGCVSAQFKAFADATGDLWARQAWAGKLAAGFTIGSNPAGDQLGTLQYLQLFASQHGMLWAGLSVPGYCEQRQLNRLGAQTGLIACSSDGAIHTDDLNTARYLGERVAQLAQRQRGPN